MNIKRGLKRIWVVGTVLWVVVVIGMTIEEFPEKPTPRFIDITENVEVKEFTKEQKEVLGKVQKKYMKIK